jgi:hypothetical protein
LKWSIATVQRHFLPWLIIIVAGGVIGSLGMIVLIGIIVTLPLGGLLIVQQYERVKEEV